LNIPDGYTSWTYLNYLCYEGLKKRYPNQAADISVEDFVRKAEEEAVEDRKDVVIKIARDTGNSKFYLYITSLCDLFCIGYCLRCIFE